MGHIFSIVDDRRKAIFTWEKCIAVFKNYYGYDAGLVQSAKEWISRAEERV